MIKEFKVELQAKALADSLGLIITKYKGVYLVSNSKEEMLANYNLGYYSEENIFYDKEIFEIDEDGFLVIKSKDIVDASLVEIPYNLRNCSFLFFECTSLKIPPIIPEGVKDCSFMFSGCISMKERPRFPKNCITTCALLYTPFEGAKYDKRIQQRNPSKSNSGILRVVYDKTQGSLYSK